MTTRRTFLRQALYTSSGALLAPTLLGCGSPGPLPENDGATPKADPAERLGVAICGLGSYANGQIAPALQQTRYCYLNGIITGSPEKIPSWQQQYAIPNANVYNGYDTMSRLADNDSIDVVYIIVPTALHAEYAVRAAEAGKHVWCEKPMAMNTKECRAIIDACAANGVRLAIGYRMQHETNTRQIMEWAETKPYGAIRRVGALAGYGGSTPTKGWRADPSMGGGALYDMGVYSINGLRYATAKVPTQVLSARRTLGPTGVDVTTEFTLAFPGIEQPAVGKTSVVERMNRLRVDAAEGWYELSPMQQYDGVRGTTSDDKTLPVMPRDQQAVQMDNDALAIMNGTPFIAPGEEGLIDVAIIEAVIEADRTSAPVPVRLG